MTTPEEHATYWADYYSNLELSYCCQAPLFWECQTEGDLLTQIPLCEVCGNRQCEVRTGNHSENLIEVYTGEKEPHYFCGYHAMRRVKNV